MNLYTMSVLGMVLCEICSEKVYREDNLSQEELLLDTINKCDQYNLHTNKLLAYLLYDCIRSIEEDSALLSSFNDISFIAESKICSHISKESLKELNFTLM